MVEQGGEAADTLTGSPLDDTLRGAGGNDSIVASAGDDLLEGGEGDDTLQGDRGFDTLRGGAGNDTYFINDLDDYWVEAADGGFDKLIISVNGAKLPEGSNIELVEYVNDALPLAYWVDALVYGASWGYMGEAVTVRYAFAESSSYDGFVPFSSFDRIATRSALAIWAAPTQLTWQEVAPDQADVVFGFAELDGEGAAGITDYGVADEPVSVLVDNDALAGALGTTSYWFDVLLHEIGHALWLKHPGDYNGSDGSGEAPFLGFSEDHDGNTVMSYNDGHTAAQARQLRPLDVAAVQYLYGVNPLYGAEDTIYRFEELTWPRGLVADGGGLDTLDASGVTVFDAGAEPALVLELRPGAISHIASYGGLITAAGAVSISYHTLIENAVGSRYNDSITGNEADNRLGGGAGADRLFGLAGDDSLRGGDGDDVLNPGTGNDVIDGGLGFDTLVLTDALQGVVVDFVQGLVNSPASNDVLWFLEAVVGTRHSDHFIGGDAAAQVRAGYFLPGEGSDTVDGGTGIDQVEWTWPREFFVLSGNLAERSVQTGPQLANLSAGDVLHGIERLRFSDQLLAFGERAEQVAQVAFALWSKDILASRYLFARGISYYDVGYSFEQLCAAAITFFADDSDARFAQRLADNVQGTRTTSDVLALMNGAGGGAAGRAHATQLMAQDSANLRHIELSGLVTNGIACDLYADGQLLFPSLLG